MLRIAALGSLLLVVPVLLAADPPPVEKQLAIQKAMLTARQYLDVNMPAEAVAALEAEIANADGNKSFLTLLREAYLAELVRWRRPGTDDARIAQVRRHLALLGGAAPTSAPPAPAATPVPATAPEPATTPVIPPPSFDPPVLVPTPTGTETVGEAVALVQQEGLRRGRQALRHKCCESHGHAEGRVGIRSRLGSPTRS